MTAGYSHQAAELQSFEVPCHELTQDCTARQLDPCLLIMLSPNASPNNTPLLQTGVSMQATFAPFNHGTKTAFARAALAWYKQMDTAGYVPPQLPPSATET